MDKQKEIIIKDIDVFLSKLSLGDNCGKWKYIGVTNKRFSTPGGPWKKPAHHFSNGRRDLVFSTEYEKESELYIVIESITRKLQTANYDFEKYAKVTSEELTAIDNMAMTYGTWGRLKEAALKTLYQQIAFNSPFIITSHKLIKISSEKLVEDFLDWGEKRDQCKDIIGEDPEGFFGYTKNFLPEVKVKNKGNIAPPDEKDKNKVEKVAIDMAIKHLKEIEGFQTVISREHERGIGYDLLAKDNETGSKSEWHVEVKGTRNSKARFFLSRNEYNVAERDPNWCLVIVTNALGRRPKLQLLNWGRAKEKFNIEPLSWYAELKPG